MKTKSFLIDHAAPVKALEFASNEIFMLSTPLDGAVKSYDLSRYLYFHSLSCKFIFFNCCSG